MEDSKLINKKDLAKLFKLTPSAISYHVAVGNLPHPVAQAIGQKREYFFNSSDVARVLGVDDLNEGFIRSDEAAKILGISRKEVKALCDNWALPLPHYNITGKTGSEHLFRKSDLESYRKDIRFGLAKISGRPAKYKLDTLMKIFNHVLEAADLKDQDYLIAKEYFTNNKNTLELAMDFGLSRERVRQINEEVLAKLVDKLNFLKNYQFLLADYVEQINTLNQRVQVLSDQLSNFTQDQQVLALELAKQAKIVYLKDVDLSVRTTRRLKLCGYRALNELTGLSSTDLMALDGFGKKCLTEIRTVLRIHGLALSDG